jgi:hypothetical protein
MMATTTSNIAAMTPEELERHVTLSSDPFDAEAVAEAWNAVPTEHLMKVFTAAAGAADNPTRKGTLTLRNRLLVKHEAYQKVCTRMHEARPKTEEGRYR